ncbi:MAG: hypothetical protein RLY61_574 [Candidatus Parcubacteria bacterium]
MLIKCRFIILILLFNLLVVSVWFVNVGRSEFLYLHDQTLFVSQDEIARSLFLRDSESLGISNGINHIMNFWDGIAYYLLYALGLSTRLAEFLIFLTGLLVINLLSYVGFYSLYKLINDTVIEHFIFIISLLYTFNPFTLVYWHTGNMSLTCALTYGLFPLTLYVFLKYTQERHLTSYLPQLLVLLFFGSFYFTLFALQLILLAILWVVCFYRASDKARLLVKTILLAVSAAIALSYFLFVVLYSYLSISNVLNSNPQNIFSMLQGGVYYQFLLYSSWAIYTDWHGRLIFEYSDHFFELPHFVGVFILYAVCLLVFFKAKAKGILTFAKLVFIMSLVLAAGTQKPFGFVFEFLYNNVPFFSIFRSPDSKFGFGVILALILCLVHFPPQLYRKWVGVLVFLATVLLAYPLLTGQAIRGKAQELDRIVAMPVSYEQAAEYINKQPSRPVIFSYPPTRFGLYETADGLSHTGSDMLKKISDADFLYVDDSYGIYTELYEKIEDARDYKGFAGLTELGITHILIRNDAVDSTYKFFDTTSLTKSADLVFSNAVFHLYKLRVANQARGLEFVSPVQFNLTKSDADTQQVTLYQTYHTGWDLYLVPDSAKFTWRELPTYQRLEKHTERGLFNTWDISQPGKYVAYFTPQAYANILGLANFLIILGLIIVSIRRSYVTR